METFSKKMNVKTFPAQATPSRNLPPKGGLRGAAFVLSCLMLSISTVLAQSTYIITGGGTQFSATKEGAVVADNQPIQTVTDAIKLDALGADCTIQFGIGATLNTGTANITFDGGAIGKDWGLITLTGKLTSACSVYNNGPICMMNGVSLNSKADITGTASGAGTTLYNYSTGTLTISGGTVLLTSNTGMAIGNESTGQVHITGGTVEATGANGVAVYSTSKGKITVSGDAKITSCNTSATTLGTIFILDNAGASETCLEITGGTIESTAPPPGMAIVNESSGAINISGGTISGAYLSVANAESGTINISGGVVDAGTCTVYNFKSGTINISGGTISSTLYAVANESGTVNISGGVVEATGANGVAIATTSKGKVTISGDATVTSSNTNSTEPGTILIKNIYGTSGTCLEITGGTIENTADEGMAIFNESSCAINISGGTVSATTGIAINNNSTGKVTISGTALVTSASVEVSTGTIYGTIVLYDAENTDCLLEISGGIVENTANKGRAISNFREAAINISGGTVSATGDGSVAIWNWDEGCINISGGTISATGDNSIAINNSYIGIVTISGGTISATGDESPAIINTGTITITGGTISTTIGWAVYDYGGTVTITGGILFAYGEDETDVIYGDYDISGNAVIVAWNEAAGTTTYEFNTDDDIYKFPATATAVWTKQGSDSGIAVANGTNTGFIPLPVTITGVNIVETQGIASVYPNPTNGEIIIDCGRDAINRVSTTITGIDIYDVMGRLVTTPSFGHPSKGGELVGGKFPSFGGAGVVLNISHLPSGIYFLKITTETGTVTRKIIKKGR